MTNSELINKQYKTLEELSFKDKLLMIELAKIIEPCVLDNGKVGFVIEL